MNLSSVFRTVVDDLVDLVSPLVARSGGGRVVAVAEGDELAVYEAPRKGAPRRLGAGERTKMAGPVELRLPEDAVLTKTLTLPGAGRDYVEPILDHRLERLVPWAPARAIYGYRIAGETAAGEMTVDFAATARDIADGWVARATARGLTPTVLGSAAEPIDQPLTLDLWRGERNAGLARARRTVAIGASVVASVVLPLLLFSIYASYAANERLASVEARSNAARRALQEAAGAGAGSREATLLAEKTPDAAMVTLIDRLARAVPEDTVLRDLEVDDVRIRLSGASSASSALIGKLEASGLMRDTRFAAPVTRGQDGKDTFEIVAARPHAQTAAATPTAAPPQGPGL